MVLRRIRIGGLGDIVQYDDAGLDSAIETDQPMKAGTPVDVNDVLRLDDVGGVAGDTVGPAGAVDSNLAEFDGITGKKIKDSGLTHVNVADAITKKHTRSHAISSTSDHSDVNLAALAADDLMQWDDPSSKWLPKSIDEVILNQDINPGFVDSNNDIFRLRTAKTPANAGDAGNTGDICWDATYLYVCIAANTWRRILHATW